MPTISRERQERRSWQCKSEEQARWMRYEQRKRELIRDNPHLDQSEIDREIRRIIREVGV